MVRTAVGPVLGTLLLAGCVSSGGASSANRTVETTTTQTVTRPSSVPAGPLRAGPTTAAEATCPFLDTVSAAADVGVRMGRVVVLSSGGKPLGCRFYADQDPYFKASEHLPGPNQPVLQIVSSRYGDPTAAHNAMVRLAEAGENAYQDRLSPQTEGLSFQTAFDPADGRRDWAYTFRTNATVVVVSTAQRDTAFDAKAVAAAIAGKF